MIDEATIRNTITCRDNPILASESVSPTLMPVQQAQERE